jgi:hypothetical protein
MNSSKSKGELKRMKITCIEGVAIICHQQLKGAISWAIYTGAKPNPVLVPFTMAATLYVLMKGKRVTLAIRGVRWLDTSVAIITYLLAELDALHIQVKQLYLDRGFFNVPVIRWLQALDIPLLMPAIKTGKQGGIKQFLKGRKSYKTTYTINTVRISRNRNPVTFTKPGFW